MGRSCIDPVEIGSGMRGPLGSTVFAGMLRATQSCLFLTLVLQVALRKLAAPEVTSVPIPSPAIPMHR